MEKLFNSYLVKWTVLCVAVGLLVGCAVAIFLLGLDEIIRFTRNEIVYIYALPLAGLVIGFAYHYWGKEVVKGNNLILEEINEPKKPIPFIMAPMVLLATWLTHFFGGSVGREGTAVQMGSTIADRFTIWFKLNNEDRKILLMLGISAGFAAVFGTPLAGAIFAIEVMALGDIRWKAFFPSIAVAYIAHFTCLEWDVFHTEYHINVLPFMNAVNLGWTASAGVLFGLCAYLFVLSGDVFKNAFEKYIAYAPLRPLIGGIVMTGGGAQLRHMKQFVEYHTGMHCRIGSPNYHVSSSKDETKLTPILSTGVGLLMTYENKEEHVNSYQIPVVEPSVEIEDKPEVVIPIVEDIKEEFKQEVAVEENEKKKKF